MRILRRQSITEVISDGFFQMRGNGSTSRAIRTCSAGDVVTSKRGHFTSLTSEHPPWINTLMFKQHDITS